MTRRMIDLSNSRAPPLRKVAYLKTQPELLLIDSSAGSAMGEQCMTDDQSSTFAF